MMESSLICHFCTSLAVLGKPGVCCSYWCPVCKNCYKSLETDESKHRRYGTLKQCDRIDRIDDSDDSNEDEQELYPKPLSPIIPVKNLYQFLGLCHFCGTFAPTESVYCCGYGDEGCHACYVLQFEQNMKDHEIHDKYGTTPNCSHCIGNRE
jgi:hypothetical protein